jgi:small-conductance mechanosensitive channel
VAAELIEYVNSHPFSTAAALAAAFFGYIFLNYYKARLSKNLLSKKIEMAVYIFSPFIFILFTYYSVRAHQDNPVYILLNYMGFLWLSSAMLKLPFRYLGMKVRFRYAPAIFLIFLSLSIALFVDVSVLYSGIYKKELQAAYEFGRVVSKFLISLGFFIYLKGVLPQTAELLREKYPNLTGILHSMPRLVVFTYIALAVMWVANIFRLDFRAVMAVALLGMMLALFSYVLHKTHSFISGIYIRERYTDLEWMLIRKHSSRLFLIAFIYIYYLLVYDVIDMSDVLEKMKTIYLFKTKLFSLSVLGVISAVMLFVFLKSVLYLFTKYLRIFFSEREFADDSDSMEVIVYNIGLLLVFTAVLLQVGITWQIVVPVAGALGIGIGFGLQTIINNYVCGFILLFSKKVRIGDFVELSGATGRTVGVTSDTVFGRVLSIDMFATTVQTYDNIEIMVPNSVFIAETIINYTRSDKFIRVRVPVGIGYGSDIELAQKLMREAIDECEGMLAHKDKEVWFVEYGDSSLNFLVLFWLDMTEGFNVASVRNRFLTSLWHKFKEHGIEIPFPQQDVWFRNELKVSGRDIKEKNDEIQ